MTIDYSSFTSLGGGLKVGKTNTPIDCRFVVEKESDIYNIPSPYIGCMVYSLEDDKFFVIKSLKNGYLDFATGETTINKPAGEEFVDWMIVRGVAVGDYEEFKGNCNCSLTFDSVQKLLDILYNINNGIDAKNKIDELANMLQNQGGGNTGGDSGDDEEGGDGPAVDYKTEPWNPNNYNEYQIALKMTQESSVNIDIIGKNINNNQNAYIFVEGANHTTENITIERNGQNEFYKIITFDSFPTKVSFAYGSYIEKIIHMCNTSNVTDMLGMFAGCTSLTTIKDISNWDTSNVTNMRTMFYSCTALTTLNLSNFNTSKVIYIYRMFENCSSLISLDISNFDINNVVESYDMFKNCSLLELSNIKMDNCSQNTINKITQVYNSTR